MNAIKSIPSHLKRYVVKQNYSQYTAQEHATWRFIMRELTHFLYKNAHPSYKTGIKKTGIDLEKIPSIQHIDKCLKKIGWRAVPVSGFIPPGAFLEMQSLGILPIASEMRQVDHLEYTPAPDIVHEAAGHAPMLANKAYSNYVRKYGTLASRCIITAQDYKQYEAIRELSDIKEHPQSTKEQIAQAQKKLDKASSEIKYASEAVQLTRMGWWTTEYGLIGNTKNAKIFGAGLLSSIGESQLCLQKHVKKIKFNLDCIHTNFDITEPQPQLYVCKDFKELENGLDQFAKQLSLSIGGVFGLKNILEAQTVNSVQLNSGLQISGKLKSFLVDQQNSKNSKGKNEEVQYIQFEGPCQLAHNFKQLSGHSSKYHAHGYGTPIGKLVGSKKCISDFNAKDLKLYGIETKRDLVLDFESGVQVQGYLVKILKVKNKNLIFTFKDCTVRLDNKILFQPEWGNFDMAAGYEVVSVFGAAADRNAYQNNQDFVASVIHKRILSPEEKQLNQMYKSIRQWREKKNFTLNKLQQLHNKAAISFSQDWLLRFELYELAKKLKTKEAKTFADKLKVEVLSIAAQKNNIYRYVENAFKILKV